MLLTNSDRIMQQLRPTDLVLDIGGWGHPFNRANWVMDCEAYETRGHYNRTFAQMNPLPPIGGTVEMFARDTWVQRDICDHRPFPFADKQFDFVVCSHTLEDIRDPLWVCSEMRRIGKAGYIEFPSRLWETCRGHEAKIAGLSHHRWLIEVEGETIRFLQKFHAIHRRRYSLPARLRRALTPEQSVTWLFWQGGFASEEVVLAGEDQLRELARFVALHYDYPRSLVRAEDAARRWAGRFNRLILTPLRDLTSSGRKMT